MRKTVPDIARRKGESNTPLVCLTAYTAPMAAALDPHCDILLVGDSVAMVLYGEPSTLQADMEMMIRHGRAVQNATSLALVVVDMPFGSYQESKEQAFRNAARILKETGASSVKIEGGAEMADTVAYLAARAVPVVGHVGLQPQSMNTMGGFKAQGMNENSAQKILTDAKAVAAAGAYAIVLEGVAESLAAEITAAVPCPVIGIGASAACDGQILVAEDMLGLTAGKKPRFVKNYSSLSVFIEQAVKAYAADVQGRKFPDAAHVYNRRQTQPAEALYGGGKESAATAAQNEPPEQASAADGKIPALDIAPLPEAVIGQPPRPDVKQGPELAAPPPAREAVQRSAFEGVLRAIPRKNRDY